MKGNEEQIQKKQPPTKTDMQSNKEKSLHTLTAILRCPPLVCLTLTGSGVMTAARSFVFFMLSKICVPFVPPGSFSCDDTLAHQSYSHI